MMILQKKPKKNVFVCLLGSCVNVDFGSGKIKFYVELCSIALDGE